MDRMEAERKKVINNEKNVEYLDGLCSKIKAIYSIWYRLMRVMKAVHRKTRAEVACSKKIQSHFRNQYIILLRTSRCPGLRILSLHF